MKKDLELTKLIQKPILVCCLFCSRNSSFVLKGVNQLVVSFFELVFQLTILQRCRPCLLKRYNIGPEFWSFFCSRNSSFVLKGFNQLVVSFFELVFQLTILQRCRPCLLKRYNIGPEFWSDCIQSIFNLITLLVTC